MSVSVSRKRAEQFQTRFSLSERDRSTLIATREHSGLTGKTLARDIGITLGALNKYESGERRPSAVVLSAWLRALVAADEQRLAA